MKKRLIFGFIIINSTLFFGQSVTKTIQLLPDTGQTSSYTASFGEDQDYLINTPSYTNNGNGTITDNVTGLMWQQVDGGEMTIENAVIYCDDLSLGGFSDWRLPTPIESFSILNHQNSNPAINTTYFTLNTAGYWWTSVYEKDSTTKVWCTNAGGGIGNHPKAETISAGGLKKFHARAVRNTNTPATIANHFTDNGDDTITDNLTQLIWQKIPNSNAQTWEQALAYAEGLSIGSMSDWRLPNIKELQSLNNELATNPSVFAPYFSSLGIHNYWSSTTLPNQTLSAWYWNTIFGITTYSAKTSTNYVLCVRGNPVLSINKYNNTSSIEVFPNPFHYNINVKTLAGNEYFELYSNLGQLIYKGKSIENEDFSALPKGIYFLKISNKTTSITKLIKE